MTGAGGGFASGAGSGSSYCGQVFGLDLGGSGLARTQQALAQARCGRGLGVHPQQQIDQALRLVELPRRLGLFGADHHVGRQIEQGGAHREILGQTLAQR